MLLSKTAHNASCIYFTLTTRSSIGLSYHSRYNNSNRRISKRKDKPRNLRKIEDPVSSADPAYLQPHVKKWKHWKWDYNALTSQQYQR